MEKLDFCPCCGGRAHCYEDTDGSSEYYVMCAKCELQTPYGSKAKVIRNWNRRFKNEKKQ